MPQTASSAKLNLKEILSEIFLVLADKEREVITKRFSLDAKPRQTLEQIGQKFAVTRERIRQIEKIALGKLRRTLSTTKLRLINELAKEILQKHGGVLLEEKIVSEIMKQIFSSELVDASIIKLSLAIDPLIVRGEKPISFKPFWYFKEIKFSDLEDIVKNALKLLEKKGDVIRIEKLISDLQTLFQEKEKTFSSEIIASVLEIDRRMKKVENGCGLMSWRHINPKSIRDKAYIVLKKAEKPLHFVEIANRIAEAGFDQKVVTTQAVHNELIRYDQFVLVGRGLYALKEWGYKEGTVADIIEGLLKQKSPLSKQEIVQSVLKQRQVKKGTISLNLQKNPHFKRVGRAVYTLDLSQKPQK